LKYFDQNSLWQCLWTCLFSNHLLQIKSILINFCSKILTFYISIFSTLLHKNWVIKDNNKDQIRYCLLLSFPSKWYKEKIEEATWVNTTFFISSITNNIKLLSTLKCFHTFITSYSYWLFFKMIFLSSFLFYLLRVLFVYI